MNLLTRMRTARLLRNSKKEPAFWIRVEENTGVLPHLRISTLSIHSRFRWMFRFWLAAFYLVTIPITIFLVLWSLSIAKFVGGLLMSFLF